MRGHVTQRTKGSWTVRVELPRDPKTNKRRQRTVTLRGTKKQAEARLAQMLVELGQGYHVDAENMTVEQYLERWLESVGGQVRPFTYESCQKAVKTFSPLLGHTLFWKLTAMDVVNKLQKCGKLKPSTVRLYLSKLRVALEQAVDWEFVHKNQAGKVKSAKCDKPETQFWTEDEAKLFLKNTTRYRYYPMWYLDLHTGLREGEIAGLVWKDIDLEKGLVYVRRTLTPFGANDPKSASGRRIIPIDTETVKVVKRHRKVMMEECLRSGEKWDETRMVFLSCRGKPLSGRYCRRCFT